MARILATHEPFLQSRAQVLVLPVSVDGNIVHPVVARCKTLFADNYERYRKMVSAGELGFGEVLLSRVPRQQTGLGVQTGRVDYIANLMVQQFVGHQVSVRTLIACLSSLKTMLYELMRYQGVRRVAFIGSPLLTEQSLLTAQMIVEAWCAVFEDIPKLTIELHFAKDVPLPEILPQKMLENLPQTR